MRKVTQTDTQCISKLILYSTRDAVRPPTRQDITNGLTPFRSLKIPLKKETIDRGTTKSLRVSMPFLKTPRWTVTKIVETFHKVAGDPNCVLKEEDTAFMRHLKGTNSLLRWYSEHWGVKSGHFESPGRKLKPRVKLTQISTLRTSYWQLNTVLVYCNILRLFAALVLRQLAASPPRNGFDEIK